MFKQHVNCYCRRIFVSPACLNGEPCVLEAIMFLTRLKNTFSFQHLFATRQTGIHLRVRFDQVLTYHQFNNLISFTGSINCPLWLVDLVCLLKPFLLRCFVNLFFIVCQRWFSDKCSLSLSWSSLLSLFSLSLALFCGNR